ncbi:hypothetical protein GCM10010833_12410 [Blastomonas aquatica]|uniref:Uncharacterized protein n=1 Tax=Blastomonas aquatica TaxID=1510276 RepID=A0ABQ1J5B0_9SPHN|nr:hypothetical protein GCM10010833_12410 [Blastomonas aquatica]
MIITQIISKIQSFEIAGGKALTALTAMQVVALGAMSGIGTLHVPQGRRHRAGLKVVKQTTPAPKGAQGDGLLNAGSGAFR